MIMLVMNDGRKRQPVRLCGLFSGPPKRDGSHRRHKVRQAEHINNALWVIESRPKETEPQPFGLSKRTKCLAIEQGVGGGIEERKEVVITRLCLTLLTPTYSPVEICAEREYNGSFGHHTLAEM